MSRPDVLIVDDDAVLREGLIELFRLKGRVAVGASNGGEALALLKEAPPPRVILLDLNMPVMDGWDFVRSLDTVPGLPAIPIAVMSGIATENLAPVRDKDAGFFSKPVNFDDLLEAVNRLVTTG